MGLNGGESLIITITSYKGGVAKTTTALHLAHFLSSTGKTLLVDGDSNRSAVLWAKNNGQCEQELHFPFDVIDDRLMARYSRRGYENIIIDTAARPSLEDLSVLVDGCDLLILPATPDGLSMAALSLIVSEVNALGSGADSKIRILVTIVPPKPSPAGVEAKDWLESQKIPHFETQIRQFVAYKKAFLQGRSVQDVLDANSVRAWQDYKDLGSEVLKLQVGYD